MIVLERELMGRCFEDRPKSVKRGNVGLGLLVLRSVVAVVGAPCVVLVPGLRSACGFALPLWF